MRIPKALLAKLRQAKMSTEMIIQTIEAVENRCMAADGPVTPTRLEMTDDEMRDIWDAAVLADGHLARLREAVERPA